MMALRPMICAASLFIFAGAAAAQPGGGGGAYVSGLPHFATGSASLGPVDGRSITLFNPTLGSGCEIPCNAAQGAACSVDLSGVIGHPGACAVASFTQDGLVMASHSVCGGPAGGGGGGGGGGCGGDRSAVHSISFPALATVSGVQWRLRDRAGNVIASGSASSSSLSFTTCGGVSGSGGDFEFGASSVGKSASPGGPRYDVKKNVKCRVKNDVVTVTGLGSDPIPGVETMEFFPIICITSPCPGDWTSVSSMRITGSGVPSLRLSDASRRIVIHPINDPPLIGDKEISVWGTAGVAVTEFCDMPPPVACAPDEIQYVATNLAPGSSVVVDCDDAWRLHSTGIVHRDLAARNILLSVDGIPAPDPGGKGPGHGGPMTYTFRGRSHELSGHVTLMKFERLPDPAVSAETYFADCTSRGSSMCVVRFLSDTGAVMASAVVSPSDPVTVTTCSTEPPEVSYTTDGRCRVTTCSSGACVLPSGIALVGVASLEFAAATPNLPAGPVSQCAVSAVGYDVISIKKCRTTSPNIVNGVDLAPVGAATIEPETTPSGERRVPVRNLGSSGEDGVDVHLNAFTGGTVDLDISGLLSPPNPGTPPAMISLDARRWSGSSHSRVYLFGGMSGSSFTATVESPSTCPVSVAVMRVTVRDRLGNPLINEVSLPALSMEIAPPPAPPGGGAVFMAISSKGAPSSAGSHPKKKSSHMQLPSPSTVTIAGLPPIPNAASISVEHAYCPDSDHDDDGIAVMSVRAHGMSELVIRETGVAMEESPSGASSGTVATAVGLGSAVLVDDTPCRPHSEFCPPVLTARNIGSSGQDGVEIKWPPVKHGTHRSLGLEWGGHGGGGEVTLKEFKGHVTLMKFDETENDASNQRTIQPDGSGCGSTHVKVRLVSASGMRLASTVIANGTPITVSSPDGLPSSFARDCRKTVMERDIVFDLSFTVSLPGLPPVPNVKSISFEPVNPTNDPKDDDCDGIQITARGVPRVKLIGGCILRPPVTMAGVSLIVHGTGVNEVLPDTTLHVSRPASEPSDRVSVYLDPVSGGGVTHDLSPLLTGGGSTCKLTARATFSDGSSRDITTIARGGAPGELDVTMDFGALNPTQLEYSLISSSGHVVHSGVQFGSSLHFQCAVSGTDPTSPPTCTHEISSPSHKLIVPIAMDKGLSRSVRFGRSQVTFSNVIWSPRSNVTEVRVTPIFPGPSPDAANRLGAIDLDRDGMPDLVILSASSALGSAVTNALLPRSVLKSYFSTGSVPTQPQRVLRLEGPIGIGGDELELHYGPGQGSITALAKEKCCRGHVTLMKVYDDEGQEAARMTNSSPPGGASVVYTPDFSAISAPQCLVTLHTADGTPLSSFMLSNGASIDCVRTGEECDDGDPAFWRAYGDGNDIALVHRRCKPLASVMTPGGPVGNVSRITVVGRGPRQSTSRFPMSFRAVATFSDGESRMEFTDASSSPAFPRCGPCDIAFDSGAPLPPYGPALESNSGVNEGDYNAFFIGFFDNSPVCDIAHDDSSPLPPFGPAGESNNGVNEGDYNCFFIHFFNGCA